MMRNYIDYGTEGYMFSDDTYNDSPDKIKALHEAYKKLPFDLEFSTYARLDLIVSKPETLPILMESGMKSVFFGIESFNHQSAKAVGKGMHPDKIKKALIDIKREYPKLIISTGFISGLPHETKESLSDTLDWLEEGHVDSYSFQVLSISEKSKIGINPKQHGYKFDSNGKWYNDHMTHAEATDIASRSKNNALSSFTFYNRLRNLGYSAEEIRVLDITSKGDIINRLKNKFKIYKRNVLN